MTLRSQCPCSEIDKLRKMLEVLALKLIDEIDPDTVAYGDVGSVNMWIRYAEAKVEGRNAFIAMHEETNRYES